MDRFFGWRLLAAVWFSVAASAALAQPVAAPFPIVKASVESQATASGAANSAIIAVDDGDRANSRILGSAGLAGIELYTLDGKRTGTVAAGEAVALDVRYRFPLGATTVTLVVAAETTGNTMRFFAFERGTLRDIGARPVPLGFAVEGICLYRNAPDGIFYAIATGDGGEIDQQMLYVTEQGKVDARQSRRLGLSSPVVHCTADDSSGKLYVAQEAVGIWRFAADPEADATPTLIDAVRLGKITREVAGLGLYDGGEGAKWLVAADSTAGRLNIYDRTRDDAFAGAIAVAGSSGTAIAEPKGVFASSAAPGVVLVADEEGPNYKIAPFADIATTLKIATGSPQPLGRYAPPPFPAVTARVETDAVPSSGDAADDPAVWANPTDPAGSLVIGTNKRGGLHLYDVAGKTLQFTADGKMNNVDLREGFMLGGKPVVLVTASDRTHKAIAIYMLDTTARRLVNVADGIQATGFADPYGLCMYRNPNTKKTYVFITDSEGPMRQWELIATRDGKVRTKQVRSFAFATQPEGCVVDDASGTLFVNEEDIGMWKMRADPNGGIARTQVATVVANPRLKDDMEGVGIYHLGGGRGYIVASSQGNNSYAVFRLEGDQAYVGSFAVVADGARGIDGASETDGLEITNANLGPGFEKGAMIAQDGRNMLPGERQNFKYVSWRDIAAVLNLKTR